MVAYLWDAFDASTIPRRQLHNLRLQSLFCDISRDGLGDHRGFIVCGYPARHAMVRKVSREVSDKRADEIIMEVLGFRISANEVVDSRRELVLVQMS